MKDSDPVEADKVIARLAKLDDLPDGWIFAGTNVSVGDARILRDEVLALREALVQRRRSEVIQLAAGFIPAGRSAKQAVTDAFALIAAVDEEFI